MGLKAKLTSQTSPGVTVDGEWYAGATTAEVGVSMEARGWEVMLTGPSLLVTRGKAAKTITMHPASSA